MGNVNAFMVGILLTVTPSALKTVENWHHAIKMTTIENTAFATWGENIQTAKNAREPVRKTMNVP